MNALYVICGLGFISLVAEIVNAKKLLPYFILGGLLLAAGLLVSQWNTNAHYFSNMLSFTNLAVAFSLLIIFISIVWFWMADDYFRNQPHQTDRAALILFVITGAIVMAAFDNMAMLFLGIEILSISLYVLAGSNKESLRSNEASFKYFLMGSFATGFLLMGMALVYGATRSFNTTSIADFLASNSESLPPFFYAGVLLIMVGMLFKLSAVPFHFWAPDVYEGSPVMITAFMSTVVKIAAVAAFFKLFALTFSGVQQVWSELIQVICVLTLLVPNVTAVYQSNVKRMLAYSSVGHIGYLLLSIIGGGIHSAETILYYLTAYATASIAAFCVISKVGENNSFNGLFKRSPLLAVVMTIALLSLAGIPPLAGFFGKYMAFVQALNTDNVSLVVIAVITSLIGVFYYFRIVVSMYLQSTLEKEIQNSFSEKVLMTLLVLLIFIMGLYPDIIVGILQ